MRQAHQEVKILIIIPARGGSKGIPRKNLRPLNGKPLIYYSISMALSSKFSPDVYVSTDDKEIAYFAKRFGASIHMRSKSLGDDLVTLDPVIFDAYQSIKNNTRINYDLVITLQPTSPLLTVESLDKAIDFLIESPNVETILSAISDTHLTWGKDENGYFPNYAARVNRQLLPPSFKETGGFFISRVSVVTPSSRIGSNVSLFVLPFQEAIDIDSFEDWMLCEYFLKRKTILFNVSGYNEIGLGHVYNSLTLAHQILNHRLVFLVDCKSDLAYRKIKENNFEVFMQSSERLEDDIVQFKPDVVINDCLDTDAVFISNLKLLNMKVVNIEDLGEGARFADLVINAIYPENKKLPNHYFGSDYFCVREEFINRSPKLISERVNEVLITFGGVDPNNFTFRTLDAIYSFCVLNRIKIKVVLGLGYQQEGNLTIFPEIEIYKNVSSISDFMASADVAFSSAGRTIYELAAIGTPSIILAQNERELSHFFASEENGFVHLGLGVLVSSGKILMEFNKLVDSVEIRREMNARMLQHDIVNGTIRVISLIEDLIRN